MTDDQTVSSVFEAALLLGRDERAAYLRDVCAGDPDARRRIDTMLAAAERTLLIDAPVEEAFADLFEATEDPRAVIGTFVGAYRIESLVGAGGMGVVYGAIDTNLKRQVAIKLLPAGMIDDPDRIARFQREAEVLASLNHPNIASIYGLERAGSTTALVMEFVDGSTLAERIARGPIPSGEAFSMARQIAEALAAAHEQGIVHRDLKPANIKVRPDGTVKVLDFGLAKVVHAPTTTPQPLHAGTVEGTPAYMSPEQARGLEADKRSDVWAYGCVLYEILSGRRVFDAEGTPDWTAIPPAIPSPVVAMMRACLASERRERLGDIAAALFVLGHVSELQEGERPAVQRRPRRSWWSAAVVTAVALAVGALVWLAVWRGSARSGTAAVTRVEVALPQGASISGQGVALSPDGRVLAVPAANRLLLRRLDRADFTALAGTDGATLPFFSPDGGWIGFVANGELHKVKVDGSTPLLIAKVGVPWSPPAWGAEGTILFSTVGSGLFKVSAGGGMPTVLTTPRRDRGEVGHVGPQWLPGGRSVLFFVVRGDGPRPAVLDISTGTWEELPSITRGARLGRYVDTGHLLMASGSTLFAVPYRPGDRVFRTAPVPVATDVDGSFAVAGDGTLAFVAAGGAPSLTSRTGRLTLVDRTGVPLPLAGPELVRVQGASSGGLAFSPDGTRIVAGLGAAGGGSDLWMYDLKRHTRLRMTNAATATTPAWAASGAQVLFNWTRDPPGLYVQGPDPAAVPHLLMKRDAGPQLPYAWRADGTVVFGVRHPQTGYDIWLARPDGSTTALLATPAQERTARLSRDGRWLAYESDASGQPEVYVRPLAEAGNTEIVSSGGGTDPRWTAANELIYRHDREVVAATVSLDGDRPRIGPARHLFDVDDYPDRYDVSPDGLRFIVLQREPEAVAGRVHLVLNWFDELRRLAPRD